MDNAQNMPSSEITPGHRDLNGDLCWCTDGRHGDPPPDLRLARIHIVGRAYPLETDTRFRLVDDSLARSAEWVNVTIDGQAAQVNLAHVTHVEAYERTPF